MSTHRIALAMIVKGTDGEARCLDRCLGGIVDWKTQLLSEQREVNLNQTGGISKYVDGIFLTLTQKNEKCEEIGKKYNAHISHFNWINDFSAARTFNFSQVPLDYDYIVWCDAAEKSF